MAFISAVSDLAAAQRLRNASEKTTFSTNGVNFDANLRQVVRCGKRSGWYQWIGLKHIFDLAVSAHCLRQRERRWSDLNIYYIFFSPFAPSGGETKRYENDAAAMTQLFAIGSFEPKKLKRQEKFFLNKYMTSPIRNAFARTGTVSLVVHLPRPVLPCLALPRPASHCIALARPA